MKTILLTGSGGFIGSHLKMFFKNKYNLLTPRSKELNLLDKGAVKKYFEGKRIDFIIHLASYGVRITPEATLDEVAKPNIAMFNNLASFASIECPMITVGSGAEYDRSEPVVKVKESDFGKKTPKDPYGYSKYLISKEIEKRSNILNLRLFGIYGAGEDPSRVTSCIVNDHLSRRPIQLNQNVVFHFIWIDDFCKIIEHFIEYFPKEKFINIAPTDCIATIELAHLVNNFSAYQVEIKCKQAGLNKEYTADNALLRQSIPDLEFTSYGKGMQLLYDFLKQDMKNDVKSFF